MENAFFPHVCVRRQYDLKGSTFDREVREGRREGERERERERGKEREGKATPAIFPSDILSSPTLTE